MEKDLDKLLDQAKQVFLGIDSNSFSKGLRNSTSRSCLTHSANLNWKPIVNRLASFGPQGSPLVEAGSSDEDSNEDSGFPSIRNVTELILDSQYTTITESPLLHKYHPPALILFNVDRRVSIYILQSVLEKIGSGILKITQVNFATGSCFILCLIVYFNTLDEGKNHLASVMYSKLSRLEKRGSLGSKIQKIPGGQIQMSVRWFAYKVLDANFDWTAVILRGIRDVSSLEIEEKFKTIPSRVEQPREIRNELCTIVIVKSIIEADKLIKEFRARKLQGKADIHPYSSVFRCPDSSAEIMFREYWRKRKCSFPIFQKPESESEESKSLISPVSATVEDGEITDTDQESQNFYVLFELSGSFINKELEKIEHSGVYVKTIYTKMIR